MLERTLAFDSIIYNSGERTYSIQDESAVPYIYRVRWHREYTSKERQVSSRNNRSSFVVLL